MPQSVNSNQKSQLLYHHTEWWSKPRDLSLVPYTFLPRVLKESFPGQGNHIQQYSATPSLENSLSLKSFLSYPSYPPLHRTPLTNTHTLVVSLCSNLEKMTNNWFSVTSNGTKLMSLTEINQESCRPSTLQLHIDTRKLLASWVVCHIKMWN